MWFPIHTDDNLLVVFAHGHPRCANQKLASPQRANTWSLHPIGNFSGGTRDQTHIANPSEYGAVRLHDLKAHQVLVRSTFAEEAPGRLLRFFCDEDGVVQDQYVAVSKCPC